MTYWPWYKQILRARRKIGLSKNGSIPNCHKGDDTGEASLTEISTSLPILRVRRWSGLLASVDVGELSLGRVKPCALCVEKAVKFLLSEGYFSA